MLIIYYILRIITGVKSVMHSDELITLLNQRYRINSIKIKRYSINMKESSKRMIKPVNMIPCCLLLENDSLNVTHNIRFNIFADIRM